MIHTQEKKYTPEMAHEAAGKGGAFMDKWCPGWTLLIDPARLELAAADRCILGQTAHCVTQGEVDSGSAFSYEDAVQYIVGRINLRRRVNFLEPGDFAAAHGFAIPDQQDAWSARENTARWEMLNIAWRQEISKRGEQS